MFEAMKDGAIICNSGHFNAEINIPKLREMAVSHREVRPLVEEIVIVSIIILIFLWHVPSALVPIVTIPVSVGLAYACYVRGHLTSASS